MGHHMKPDYPENIYTRIRQDNFTILLAGVALYIYSYKEPHKYVGRLKDTYTHHTSSPYSYSILSTISHTPLLYFCIIINTIIGSQLPTFF